MKFLFYGGGSAKYLPRHYSEAELKELKISTKAMKVIMELQKMKWTGLFLKFSSDYNAIQIVCYSNNGHFPYFDLNLFLLNGQSPEEIIEEARGSINEKLKVLKRMRGVINKKIRIAEGVFA